MTTPDRTYQETTQSRRASMRAKSRQEADAIFALAGFTVTRVWELANGYWPDHPNYDDVREPWWLMLTDIGPVQIGWRKRVLHIQWDACKARGVVTEDDVTKGDTMVHAYSTDKAVVYLRNLRKIAEGAN